MIKFLIIGPAWVGDMVMSQSLYKLIKQNNPNAHITVLAPTYTLPLLRAMPEVDETLSLNLPRKKLNFFKRRAIGKSLIHKKFTHAIVLPNSFKSALIPYFAKIPKRTGFIGELRYGLLNDYRKLDPQKLPKMIDRFCALGCPEEINLSEHLVPKLILKKEWQENTLKKWPIDLSKPILALCPGAEFGPSKQWPAKYFAELAAKKIKEGWQVCLFGSKKDEKIGQEISDFVSPLVGEGRADRVNSYIGLTTLEEAMVLLSKAHTVVSNDSGLMHVACALDKPVIAIYGSTTSKFTPPLSSKAEVVTLNLSCQPCFKRVCPLKGNAHMACLNQLTPDKVDALVGALN